MADIPDDIKDRFQISFVKWIDEMFNIALAKVPTQKKKATTKKTGSKRGQSLPKKEKSPDAPLLPH